MTKEFQYFAPTMLNTKDEKKMQGCRLINYSMKVFIERNVKSY